jgi:hypothetical protein
MKKYFGFIVFLLVIGITLSFGQGRNSPWHNSLVVAGTSELKGAVTCSTIDATIVNTTAAGDKGTAIQITQGTNALTGTLIGGSFGATNANVAAANGIIIGVEAKARAASPAGVGHTIGLLTGVYASADAKTKTATTLRGLEVSLDGAAGGTSTLATGVVINNNSSAVQTTSYGITLNDGEGSGGHKVFTSDILLQYGATVNNSSATLLTITETTVDIEGALTATSVTSDGAVAGTTINGTTGTLRVANLGFGNTAELHPLSIGGALVSGANRFTVDTLGTLAGGAYLRDTSSFSGTLATKAISIPGATANDFYFISKRIALGVSTDALVDTMGLAYMAKTDSLIVIRPVTSPSNAKFSWFRVK